MSDRLRDRLRTAVLDWRCVSGAFLALAVVAGAQQLLLGPHPLGNPLTHYNNFKIFTSSFHHLVRGQDLYTLYSAEHWDLFKYSPTFAAFMAPFAVLPEAVGLLLWNLLNAWVFLLAIRRFPLLDARGRALMCWFLAPEFLTSVQNSQSNVLLAGLLILAFDLLEERRTAWATLAIVASFYIKLFGIFAAILFLLYPQRRRALFWSVAWAAILALVPLLFVSAEQLRFLYQSWLHLLSTDHSASTGLSVMGWLHGWFHLDPPKLVVVLVGAVVCLLPLVRVRSYERAAFRALFLASSLVWMIIFNHKAESATFIIAMAGVAIWYFSQPRRPEDLLLLALAFLLTSMSPRFPDKPRLEVVVPYVLKAVPCILIWMKIVLELAFSRFEAISPAEVAQGSQ